MRGTAELVESCVRSPLARQIPVCQINIVVAIVKHDVFQFDVSVHHAFVVAKLQAADQLLEIAAANVKTQTPFAADQLQEIPAAQIAHHEILVRRTLKMVD